MIECNPRATDGALLMDGGRGLGGARARSGRRPGEPTLIEAGRTQQLDFAVFGQMFTEPLKRVAEVDPRPGPRPRLRPRLARPAPEPLLAARPSGRSRPPQPARPQGAARGDGRRHRLGRRADRGHAARRPRADRAHGRGRMRDPRDVVSPHDERRRRRGAALPDLLGARRSDAHDAAVDLPGETASPLRKILGRLVIALALITFVAMVTYVGRDGYIDPEDGDGQPARRLLLLDGLDHHHRLRRHPTRSPTAPAGSPPCSSPRPASSSSSCSSAPPWRSWPNGADTPTASPAGGGS